MALLLGLIPYITLETITEKDTHSLERWKKTLQEDILASESYSFVQRFLNRDELWSEERQLPQRSCLSYLTMRSTQDAEMHACGYLVKTRIKEI